MGQPRGAFVRDPWRPHAAPAMKLNEPAYEHPRQLIVQRHIVLDDRGDWSEHQPAAADENPAETPVRRG